MRVLKYLALLFLAVSCRAELSVGGDGTEYARWFSLSDSSVVIISPVGGSCDTLSTLSPFSELVCMSSTHVAALSLIGATDLVKGVSGLRYVSDSVVRSSDSVVEVGDLDYERVLSVSADLLCASGQGSSDYGRLEEFGVKIVRVFDFMEDHPLARAEYVRLFGALTGKRAEADSIFSMVKEAYLRTASLVSSVTDRPLVLVNAPYRDAWYVPGKDGYFARLIEDAGAEVAGARPGSSSSIMTVEKAFSLASAADFWIHPGWASSLDELRAEHPLFKDFAVLASGKVYNNTLRSNPGGGNDYYESGSVRPDLVLQDLVYVFHPECTGEKNNVSREGLHYYIELH